ncbi:hypothetical protein F5050DRAFT_1787772 [Lentinula boryana]|uniref:Uncharacterized protein n=1 Tax=Lentinula boryana TaxID=40481 RepID=A0ABQ8Q1P9_9AGAR|nr:hypothetical protein F5050DRAFT_1787772 [Lentinula boryana]
MINAGHRDFLALLGSLLELRFGYPDYMSSRGLHGTSIINLSFLKIYPCVFVVLYCFLHILHSMLSYMLSALFVRSFNWLLLYVIFKMSGCSSLSYAPKSATTFRQKSCSWFMYIYYRSRAERYSCTP